MFSQREQMKMRKLKRTPIGTIDFSSSSNWRLTKIFLSIIGAWPLQSPTNRRVLTGVTSILIGSMFIPEVLKLITVRKDTNEILVCLPFISMHVISIVAIVNLFFNSKSIKTLLVRIRKDWQCSIVETEQKILRNEQHDHGKILTLYIIYMCFVTLLYVMALTFPIIFDQIKPLNDSRPRIKVYHPEFFLDKEKYDVPMLIHSLIFTPFPTAAIVAFDTIFATLTQHACSIFKIIGRRLQFLMNDMEHRRSAQDCSMIQIEIRKTLVESIRMHGDILQFVHLLGKAFSTSLFIMNFMSMMNLSMTAYQAVNHLDSSAEIVGTGFYAGGQLIRLYFRCWHGQMLINSSESIFNSVYQANWYDLPSRLQLFIVLILARGRKQSKITAGKIFDMSMENFTFVVRTAISYFTVLRSMQ